MTYGEKIEAIRAEILVVFNKIARDLGGDNGAELALAQARAELSQAHGSLAKYQLDQADYPDSETT